MIQQQVYLGTSSIKELLPTLQKLNPQHIFLVRGKSSYEICGAKAIVNEVLGILHCRVTEFYDFEDNPKAEDLVRGLQLLHNSQVSVILAVGGGSVLDMAKLIRFFYSYSGDVIGKEFKKERALLPLIVLPTTAGTGSEATHFAVLYKDKVKYSVEHDEILPDTVIVYPPFTYNNPSYLTACTGFDALAQCIEAYWNVNATAESDEYAERAIDLLWNNLPLAVNSPTVAIRNMISEGSYWAGRAINITKTTAPHAFSYPFTTYYGYPHGHAVALTFPFFFSYCNKINDIKIKAKMERLCNLIGLHDNILSLSFIKEYIDTLGLLRKHHDKFNVAMILQFVNMDRLSNYPVDIDIFFLRELSDFLSSEY